MLPPTIHLVPFSFWLCALGDWPLYQLGSFALLLLVSFAQRQASTWDWRMRGREINVFLSHALPALAPGFWARLYPVIMIAMFGCPFLPGPSCQWSLITLFLPLAQISSLSSRLWMLQYSLVPIIMPMLLEVVCIKSLFKWTIRVRVCFLSLPYHKYYFKMLFLLGDA